MKKTHFTQLGLGIMLASCFAQQAFSHSQIVGESLKTHHFHTEVTPLQPNFTNLPEQRTNSPWELSLQTGWASKYISEGIDVFGKGGVWEIAPEIIYKNFSFLTWYGISDSLHNTSELKFIGSYDIRLHDQWLLTPSYEHCIAQPGTVDSDTIALTLCYEVTSWLTLGIDVQSDVTVKPKEYYDIFCEIQFPVWEGTTGILCVLYAWNEGYLGDGFHRGSNTIDYALAFETELSENFSLIISFNYSQALTALRHFSGNEEDGTLGQKLGNEFWCGYYVRYTF